MATEVGGWIKGLPITVPFNIEELVASPIEPKHESGEDEEPVGEMNDEEKLLHSLWMRCKREADMAATEAQYETDPELERAAGVRYSEMVRMSHIFENMLWTALWQRIGPKHNNLGLCRGFKLTTSNQPEHPLLDALSSIRRNHHSG